MGFELNVSSDLDIDTSSSFLDELDTSIPEIGETTDADKDMIGTTAVQTPVNMTGNVNTNFSAINHVPQGYVPQYMPQQSYTQQPGMHGAAPQADAEKLTTAQWFGTLILSTCLGVISIVLLILWGFSEGSREPRRSFARAMLIMVPIIHLLSFVGIGVILSLLDP